MGAANVGQVFTEDIYFWGRPSCAGDGYDASSSAGSNKGPTNEEYLAEVETRIDTFLVHHPYLERKDVPAEMVTASGSGLDPDALFAALTAVCSQLAIPMPWGVPINLALFAVYMAGTMLGPIWGAASQLVYLLLAAVGVPVMAGMQGGPAVLLGKTGGYAIGYLLAALIAGAFAAKLPRKFGWLALGCVVGCAACYVLGTIWFMVLTGLDLPTSLTYCVIPYLPGDVIKIALASLLTIQLDKRMPKI